MGDYAPKMVPFRKTSTIGRNDPCPCGSGKKYKACHRTQVDNPDLALPTPQASVVRREVLRRFHAEHGRLPEPGEDVQATRQDLDRIRQASRDDALTHLIKNGVLPTREPDVLDQLYSEMGHQKTTPTPQEPAKCDVTSDI